MGREVGDEGSGLGRLSQFLSEEALPPRRSFSTAYLANRAFSRQLVHPAKLRAREESDGQMGEVQVSIC